MYSDGGDPLTVMDQVRDTKNTDDHWLEQIDLREAVGEAVRPGKAEFWHCAFLTERPRWRWPQEVGISQAQVSRLEKNALQSVHRESSIVTRILTACRIG